VIAPDRPAPDRLVRAERALRACAADAVLDTVRHVLREDFGAASADLLLADYQLSVLQPVAELPHTARPLPIARTPAGRAFVTQQPVLDPAPDAAAVLAHLPVTVRGDRLGILSVTVASRPGPDAVAELANLAVAVGHELLVADRDTDLYLQARRRDRLTLAAEMQWQLLPGRASARPEYCLGGHLEPAYSINGDNFDWSATSDHLLLSVSNGMGQGIPAALLTALAVGALRNARRAGLPLEEQVSLADQAVHAQYGGKEYVATLLLRFEFTSGRVLAVDAGSPQLFRQRGDEVVRLPLERQLPLGMFEGTHYREQELPVTPGDRLVVVSDGVHAARSPGGLEYGPAKLAEIIDATSSSTAPEAARQIIHHLIEHHEGAELVDDALVVCVDWHGRTAG
jgi:Stage II sporulation protein E (SpoIIE)